MVRPGTARIRSMVANKGKKRVLSNKQLTRQVRTLRGTEGSLKRIGGALLPLYSAVTLADGVADLNYFSTQGYFQTDVEHQHLYYDVYIKLLTTATAGATLRLIYGFDMDADPSTGNANRILAVPSNSASNLYQRENGTPGAAYIAAAKHKNAEQYQRYHLIKDLLIPLIANEPKCFRMRLPLYGRKTKAGSTTFEPFMLLLSDEAASTATVTVNHHFIDLSD